MLGESIFSLLIVDVAREGREFFVVFYLCLSTIIFLQFLHFQSQPHGAETHAMRRNKSSGSMWSMLQQIFSFGLVMLGSTFTFFLSYAGSKNEAVGRRALLGNRMLADGSADQISQAEFQAVADLFSGTLAIVFLCLNAINLLHLGKEEVQNRCVVQGRIHWKGMGTIIVHAVLIVISSSFSQWVTEPRDLAIAGLLCVLAQLSLRKFEALHLSEKSRHRRRLVEGRRGEKPVAVATDDETGEAPWPDVTHARVEETEAPQS